MTNLGVPNPSEQAILQQVVASFPPETPPRFSHNDRNHFRSLLDGRVSIGMDAFLPTYYHDEEVAFWSAPPRETQLRRIDVPEAQWSDWQIVSSHGDVYAEPSSTQILEIGATALSAEAAIGSAFDALSFTTNLTVLDNSLRMLGFVPQVYGSLQAGEDQIANLLDVAASRITLYGISDARHTGSAIEIDTPSKELSAEQFAATIADPSALSLAQIHGNIASTRFESSGMHQAIGDTPAYTAARAGIPRLQRRYLRRLAALHAASNQ